MSVFDRVLTAIGIRSPHESEQPETYPPKTHNFTPPAEISEYEGELRQALARHASSSRMVRMRAESARTRALSTKELLEGLLERGRENDEEDKS